MVVLYQLSYKGKILKTAVTLSDLGFCGNSNLEHMKNRREDNCRCSVLSLFSSNRKELLEEILSLWSEDIEHYTLFKTYCAVNDVRLLVYGVSCGYDILHAADRELELT